MTIKLKLWTSREGEQRVYINGTNRDHNGLYVCAPQAHHTQANIVSSRTCDQPAGRQSGDVYGKREKDRAVAREALAAIGITKDTPFAEIVEMANGVRPLVEVMEA